MNVSFKPAAPRNKLFPVLYVAVVSLVLYALLSNNGYDDPFITYRYAHNLARGLGFVYNPGERILSTTTPLFAMLLALLNLAFSDLPKVANLIGAISIALGGIILWDLSRLWKTPAVGWTSLLLYPTFTLPLMTLGSETPLYITLCLATFVFYIRQRYAIAAIAVVLATLTRPDGVLVAIVLGFDYLLHLRRSSLRSIPWIAVLIFVGLLIPWFLFAWLYFGYPLPVTLVAKQQQGTLAVSQTFAPGFLWILGWYVEGWQYWLEAVLALVGLYWLIRYARQWGLLLVWTALYFVAYSLLGVSRYFWYYAPLVPGFIVLVGLGVTAVVHTIQVRCMKLGSQGKPDPAIKLNQTQQSISTGKTPRCQRMSYLLAGLLLISLTAAQAFDIWKLSSIPDPRSAAYRAVGEWIRNNTPPDSVVSSLEVGIIGYYADRRVVDFAGLIRPEVAQRLSNGADYEDTAIWTVENYSPDYVVLVKGDLRTLKQGYLEEHCQVGEQFQSNSFGYAAFINIYECQ